MALTLGALHPRGGPRPGSGLLAAAWHSPGYLGHLGEGTNTWKVCLSLCLSSKTYIRRLPGLLALLGHSCLSPALLGPHGWPHSAGSTAHTLTPGLLLSPTAACALVPALHAARWQARRGQPLPKLTTARNAHVGRPSSKSAATSSPQTMEQPNQCAARRCRPRHLCSSPSRCHPRILQVGES